MTRARRALLAAILTLGLLGSHRAPGTRAPQAAVQTWLLVSDLHLDPYARARLPSSYGADANPALFTSTLAAMRRADPHPAVVAIAGDLFAHHFERLARERAPHASARVEAERTMSAIAGAFARAFPHAQFALVPGNNDDPCGDYRRSQGKYAAAVARIWAPLVDRGGAAPRFARDYAALGAYVARLPQPGLRLVAVDSVVLAWRFAGDCRGERRAGGHRQLAWLDRTLAATPVGVHNVLLMHVPPGYDAFATELTRGVHAWPLLRRRANRALRAAIALPTDRVAFALAGHTHRFDLRLAGDVPILIAGAISPIYGNNPNFAVVRVDTRGIVDVTLHAYDERRRAWFAARSFDRAWNVTRLDGASLRVVHRRLARSAAMRRRWDRQSSAWASPLPRLWGAQWRVAWCAQTHLRHGFARCAGTTARRRWLITTLLLAAVAAVAALSLIRRRRHKPAPGDGGATREAPIR